MSAQPKMPDKFKDYVPVAERIDAFYTEYPHGRITTKIIEHDRETGFILMKAYAYRSADDVEPSATGHAFELRSEGYVNKTSYVENCESSAVGRALALLNFETKRGIASREEMQKVARMQTAAPAADSTRAKTFGDLVTPKQLVAIRATANAVKVDAEKECAELYQCKPEELSRERASEFIQHLKTLPHALTPAQQINQVNQEKIEAATQTLDRDTVIAEFNRVKKALRDAGHPKLKDAIGVRLFVRETIRGFKGWLVQVDPEKIDGLDGMETALIADIVKAWSKTLDTFKPVEKADEGDEVF